MKRIITASIFILFLLIHGEESSEEDNHRRHHGFHGMKRIGRDVLSSSVMMIPSENYFSPASSSFTSMLLSSSLSSSSSSSSGCPPVICVCRWKSGKKTVSCVNIKLDLIPSGIDPETQVLDLSENSFTTFSHRIFANFGLINLQKIFLNRLVSSSHILLPSLSFHIPSASRWLCVLLLSDVLESGFHLLLFFPSWLLSSDEFSFSSFFHSLQPRFFDRTELPFTIG